MVKCANKKMIAMRIQFNKDEIYPKKKKVITIVNLKHGNNSRQLSQIEILLRQKT